MIEKFVHILALCHTIIVENKDGNITYNASSPDELALINAARYFGMVFESRDENNRIVLYDKRKNTRVEFHLLNVIEFTSTRKRMSVIVKTSDNKIYCLTKGADSIILPRLKPGQEEIKAHTLKYIEEYANEGLRTLLLVQKEVDSDFYLDWNRKY